MGAGGRLGPATLRSRTWPWFALAAVLFVVGFALFSGSAQAVVEFAATMTLVGAAVRGVGLALRDDPVRQRLIARRGLDGMMARETKAARTRDHGSSEREKPLPAEQRPWP
jgi:hypothetical protein